MFANGNSISYLYDAAGRKLRTVHILEGDSVTTDYCGNVVYENGVPQILLTEVGYVSLTDGQYHYNLKDHQGNNRVVVDEEGAVEEVNHYYPFEVCFLLVEMLSLISIMARSWIVRVGWTGMIMERGCMIRCWEDGMRWMI